MNKESFNTVLVKFLVDTASGAVAGAAVVLAATDLSVVGAKALAIAVAVGALNGAINAARRYAVTKVGVPT